MIFDMELRIQNTELWVESFECRVYDRENRVESCGLRVLSVAYMKEKIEYRVESFECSVYERENRI